MMNLFGVTPDNLKRLISIALSSGGDYADIYFEYSTSNELALRDGEVNAAGSNIDYGAGIRVLSEDRTGYAYTEITSMKEMERAAKVAAKIADGSIKENLLNINSFVPLSHPNFYPVKQRWDDLSVKVRIPFLEELNERIFSADERVIKVLGRIADSNSKILFYNSDGVITCDERPSFAIVATAIMASGDKVENGTASRSYRAGFEILTKEIVREVADDNKLYTLRTEAN